MKHEPVHDYIKHESMRFQTSTPTNVHNSKRTTNRSITIIIHKTESNQKGSRSRKIQISKFSMCFSSDKIQSIKHKTGTLPRWNWWPHWRLAHARSPSLATVSRQIEHETEPKPSPSSPRGSPSAWARWSVSPTKLNLLSLLPKPITKSNLRTHRARITPHNSIHANKNLLLPLPLDSLKLRFD